MCGCLDGLDVAADVKFVYAVAEVGYGRMCGIVGTKYVDSLFYAVWGIDILN